MARSTRFWGLLGLAAIAVAVLTDGSASTRAADVAASFAGREQQSFSSTAVESTQGELCFGLDLDPRYVDVAVRRWEGFTGKQAERAEGAK